MSKKAITYIKNFPTRLYYKIVREFTNWKTKTFPKPNQRKIITKDIVNSDLKILEIGPFTQPLLVGSNIKYFDLMDRESLIRRGESMGLDVSRVPEIQFIHPEGDLDSIPEKFDVVVSAHVIEHQPDLIRHLQAVERLLENSDAGLYRLVIPDKRYCFDSFLPESSLREIIQNHENKLTKPDRLRVIQNSVMTTHNYPHRHWKGDSGDVFIGLKEKWLNAEELVKENSDKYIDVHMWQFTPKSFEFIISALNALGHTRFKVEKITNTFKNDLEFSALLRLSR